MLDEHRARQIDDSAFERRAHLLLELVKGRAVGDHRRTHRRLGGEHGEFLAGLDHRAFDEQPVDAAWVLDRVGETAAGFEIERERAGAEMDRSEEHTSELQSLMRISYAVFCLKKKKKLKYKS